jgi:hypothetical protein
MLDEKTEEDMIIENLVLEGGQQFEDQEFMPIRQSLYEIESIAPQYDEGMERQFTKTSLIALCHT